VPRLYSLVSLVSSKSSLARFILVSNVSIFLPAAFFTISCCSRDLMFASFFSTRWSKVGGNLAFVIGDFGHFEISHLRSVNLAVIRVFFSYSAFLKLFSDSFCASPCTKTLAVNLGIFSDRKRATILESTPSKRYSCLFWSKVGCFE